MSARRPELDGPPQRLRVLHPWVTGVVAGVLVAGVAAALDAAFGGNVSWALAGVLGVVIAAMVIASDHRRRSR